MEHFHQVFEPEIWEVGGSWVWKELNFSRKSGITDI